MKVSQSRPLKVTHFLFFSFLSLSLLSFNFVTAKEPSKNEVTKASAESLLQEVLRGYAKFNHLSFQVEKSVKSEILMTESNRRGELQIEKDRFRLELKGEPSSLMVFDGKNVWIEEGKQVTKSPAKNLKNEITIFNRIFFKGRIENDFKILNQKHLKNNEAILFTLEPRSQDFAFKKLEVTILEKRITKLSYLDDLDSRTTIKILSEEKLNRNKPQRFRYTLKPGLKVTEI